MTFATKAIPDVLAERQRQIIALHYTPEHDDTHDEGMLAQLAACFALHAADQKEGWIRGCLLSHEQQSWFKPKGTRHDLVVAAALIIAEIERFDRFAAKEPAE